MPLQNRVNPYGEILASSARGTFMGNRGGALHNAQRKIVRQYTHRRWITCLLEFKGRWRPVMSPGQYTELFFLDEAVAFAAGHRPCAECRRAQFNAFRESWIQAKNAGCRHTPLADEIDLELHASRIDTHKNKVVHEAELNSLPDGCFVRIESECYLVCGQRLVLWSPDGYRTSSDRPLNINVTVLTPRPIVGCFRNGYQPEIHESALEV